MVCFTHRSVGNMSSHTTMEYLGRGIFSQGGRLEVCCYWESRFTAISSHPPRMMMSPTIYKGKSWFAPTILRAGSRFSRGSRETMEVIYALDLMPYYL